MLAVATRKKAKHRNEECTVKQNKSAAGIKQRWLPVVVVFVVPPAVAVASADAVVVRAWVSHANDLRLPAMCFG